MEKILIVGNNSNDLQNLGYVLETQFQVKKCGPKTDLIDAMIQVADPELIVFFLAGLHVYDEALFKNLSLLHEGIPVLTIGTETERHRFLRFYNRDQFEHLLMPADINDMVAAVCNRLGLEYSEKGGRIVVKEKSEKRHVLVVDDNPMFLRSVKEMLDENYEVSLATSVIKAMTSIGRQRPDIILLDYEMPICDGKQILEMIRQDDELRGIPVIFLTAICDKKHIEAVLNLNPAGYLLKPPVKNVLIEAIEGAMDE